MSGIFHPELHLVFELAGYVAGYLVYRELQRRYGDPLSANARANTGILFCKHEDSILMWLRQNDDVGNGKNWC